MIAETRACFNHIVISTYDHSIATNNPDHTAVQLWTINNGFVAITFFEKQLGPRNPFLCFRANGLFLIGAPYAEIF